MSRDQDETPERRAMREQLQRITLGLASMIKAKLDGSKIGFALVLFDFGEQGSLGYAANGVREDLVKVFRELADKLETDAQARKLAANRTHS